MSGTQLRVTEIFYSLQGESKTIGHPTVFIRLTGCPLRCTYCDTAYAFSGGTVMTLGAILTEAANYRSRFVTVTGGEPLAQKGCCELLVLLADQGYDVSLETSGAIDISKVDSRVTKVMDLKTPDSGEESRNLYSNLLYLGANDQVKFVIGNDKDYRWAVAALEKHGLTDRCEVLFSPSMEKQNPTKLADMILKDRLPVRFQMQLHKILWGDQPGK